jgi:hypothetical protein
MHSEIVRAKQYRDWVRASLVAIVMCGLVTGCAGLPQPLQPISSAIWNTINKGRTPGAQLLESPQDVSAKFDCPNRPRPWVLLTSHQLLPAQLATNDELNNRFEYVLCAAPGQAEVRGILTRRVRTGGEVIWNDVGSNYDLKPGKWVVDFFLTIPQTAVAGPYEFEIDFGTDKLLFRDTKSFTVVRP